jgi:polar amino acid transport system substrate-binding protein
MKIKECAFLVLLCGALSPVYGMKVKLEKLRLAYFSTPPLICATLDPVKPIGAVIDYFEKIIAPKIGVEIVWHLAPLARINFLLNNGLIDGVVTYPHNKDRAKLLYYSQKRLHALEPVIVVQKNHPLKSIDKVDDILKHNMVINIHPRSILPKLMQDHRINYNYIYGMQFNRRNLEMIVKGIAESGFSASSLVLKHHIKQMGLDDQLRLVYIADSDIPVYFTISKKKSKSLIDTYDRIVEEISQSYVDTIINNSLNGNTCELN